MLLRDRLNASLRGKEIFLSGCSGWFGRVLLSELDATQIPKLTTQSSRETKEFRFGELTRRAPGREMPSSADLFIDFAFQTRDKVLQSKRTSEEEAPNDGLITETINSLRDRRFAKYVGISSGAAVNAQPWDEYGLAKSKFENLYLEHRNPLDSVARVWSVSGSFCTKPEVFAFAGLMKQALHKSNIEISSAGRVLRRYCAIEEVLTLLLTTSAPPIFDSGGELVEIGELAKIIGSELNPAATVIRSVGSGTESAYFAATDDFEVLMESQGLVPMTIREQVVNALRGFEA
jgi:hypothetical protein